MPDPRGMPTIVECVAATNRRVANEPLGLIVAQAIVAQLDMAQGLAKRWGRACGARAWQSNCHAFKRLLTPRAPAWREPPRNSWKRVVRLAAVPVLLVK